MTDLEQARSFLELLDPDAEQFCFQLFDDSKAKRPALARVYHGSLDDLAATLAKLNKAGAGIFVTVNQTDGTGRKSGNIIRIRAVFVDLDGSPLQPVLACALEPHIIVESSPGRWHVYWIVEGMALDQFAGIQKAIIARFNGDRSVHDVSRVMRLPGHVHQKAEPFMTRVHGLSDRMPYTADQIVAEFPPAKAATNGKARSPASDSPFRDINSAALADLDAWVPALFPAARPANDGYRVSSDDLGRDLEEDLSITPQGIKDFGLHDLGDDSEGKRTPIDLVIEHGGEPDAVAAADWLALQLGIDFDLSDSAANDLSHDALALEIDEKWRRAGRHVALWGQWLFWASPKWTPDECLASMTRCRDYLRRRADAVVRAAQKDGDHEARPSKENGKVAAQRANGGRRAKLGA
jgi:hypothetical protein